MAIETMFLPESEIYTSLQILKEFILTFVSSDEIDFMITKPRLDDSIPLYKPILYFELLPGSDKSVGFGRAISNGDHGKFHNFSVMLYLVISDSCGGMERAYQISDTLRYIFLTYGYQLSDAKLRKPVCSPMREISQTNYSQFFGGRWMITFQTCIRY